MLTDRLLKGIRAWGLFVLFSLFSGMGAAEEVPSTGAPSKMDITTDPAELLEFQISFAPSEMDITTDPTELFSDEELAEGGSTVQPSIWSSHFAVDGGMVTMAIMVDRWCGAQECPFRFRLEVDNGPVLLSHVGRNFGMICQDMDAMSVDPIELTVTACGVVIDLKTAM